MMSYKIFFTQISPMVVGIGTCGIRSLSPGVLGSPSKFIGVGALLQGLVRMYLCQSISKTSFYAQFALHMELKSIESKLVLHFIVGSWPTTMAEDMLVDHTQSFSSFSHILDARILRALAEQGFARPTLVQAKAIPLALEGRDILARARTGSGKTAAYCIPLVQKILNIKSVGLLSGSSFVAGLGKANVYTGH
jgi:hypothetical protein